MDTKMKKFRFKDGSVITASTAEEAKAKHKITAFKDSENLEYHLNNLRNEISGFIDFINKTIKVLDKFESSNKCTYQYSSDFMSEKAEFDIRVRRVSDNEVRNYAYTLSKGLKSTLKGYKYFGVTPREIPNIIKDIEEFLS